MKRHWMILLPLAVLLAGCKTAEVVQPDTTLNQYYDATGDKGKLAGNNRKTPEKKSPAAHPSKPAKIEMLDWGSMNLLGFFNDQQRLQMPSARENGIEPMSDNANIFKLVISGKVVKIESCDEYVLATLTHSYPYLVPKAADMLKVIGARVQEITGTKSRILVTSCLRTMEKQMDLSETNANAASYSCHYYGTTFDLAYNAAGELKGGISYETYFNALCQAVHELREQNKLYVLYETGQHCLHMTVR